MCVILTNQQTLLFRFAPISNIPGFCGSLNRKGIGCSPDPFSSCPNIKEEKVVWLRKTNSRGPWHQYNTNIVLLLLFFILRNNWILPRELNIAEEGITLAKDPLRSWIGPFAWNSARVTLFWSDTRSSISNVTINNGALNRADFNVAMYYLTRLLIPRNKNLLYGNHHILILLMQMNGLLN